MTTNLRYPGLEQGAPIPPSSRSALKEWAVACEALGRGDQIILLRKGGIREEHREFRVEQTEFLLFPTLEHQRSDLLKSPAQTTYVSLLSSHARPPRVTLRYWCKLAEVIPITEAEELDAVAPFHIWSDGYARERLRWRPRKPLHLMLLRVHRLPEGVEVPVLDEYGGCKSWLMLAEPIRLEGAAPVLDDAAFGREVDAIHGALGREQGATS